ncbi:hypothetical protein Deba_1344 [Desulfarculus baarsii DSM 2075]|uniref:Uncharacterized protein n=1 Tax=Desulfarculus baarsii (strain ATCC 33931 / DSM 2075 / LMG 7858 / VKM B-1802 / 2st14) TaxID=644282 RepID=E1QGL9_DESB2|nr:hypothetical protein [Desulfarculus baarsii]ADK84712.1 hypothetical protein Deba_1344 [Desulfarculus baarsii DSM 2075]
MIGWPAMGRGGGLVVALNLERRRGAAALLRVVGSRPPLVVAQRALPLGAEALPHEDQRQRLAREISSLTAKAGPGRLAAWISLPSQAASFHPTPAPEGLGRRLNWRPEDHLAGLTPFAPADLRAAELRATAGGPWILTALRRDLVDDAQLLAAQCGLRLTGLAPRAAYLALALAPLAGRNDDSRLVYAGDDCLDWLVFQRGQAVAMGRVMADGPLAAELAGVLASQMLAHGGRSGAVAIICCGPRAVEAQALLEGLDWPRLAPERRITLDAASEPGHIAPNSLGWPLFPLVGFAAVVGAGGRPPMNLAPQAEGPGWLERPGLSLRLGAAVLVLAAMLAGGQVWRQWRLAELARERVAELRTELKSLSAAGDPGVAKGLATANEALARRGEGLRLLQRLGQILPAEASLLRLEYDGRRASFVVRSIAPNVVAQALDNQPDMALAELTDAPAADGGQVVEQSVVMDLSAFR